VEYGTLLFTIVLSTQIFAPITRGLNHSANDKEKPVTLLCSFPDTLKIMFMMLYKPVYYLFGVPVFYYIAPVIAGCIFFLFYWLYRQSNRDIKRAMESTEQDFTYDIKHVHLN
jgi:hypothetical protein